MVILPFQPQLRRQQLASVEVGDLVLIQSTVSREQCLHRLVARKGELLQTKGDNSVFVDPWVPESQALGVALLSRDPAGGWYKERQKGLSRKLTTQLSVFPRFRLSRIPQMVLTAALKREKIMSINRDKSVEWHQIGSEVVIYSYLNDEMYTLNETASFIWLCLSKGENKEQILIGLHEHFQVETTQSTSIQLERDLDSILSDFKEKHFL